MKERLYKRLKRNIFLDYINTCITNLNMQSSIWVLYLAYCGLSLAQIGLLEGIYHATSILCEIPSGAVADLLGRKRSMIAGRICVAVSCMIMLFFRSFRFFALSFAIQALGNNFNSGSEEALIYDSMKYIGQEERYMGVYGRINMIIEVSQGIATVMGGILAEYSWFWCYGACLIIAVLALLPVLFMTEAPVGEGGEEQGCRENCADRHPERPSVWKTVRHHFETSHAILRSDIRILRIILYYSVVFAVETLLLFYSQQYYAQMGYNKIQISLILLQNGAASCLGAIYSGKLYRKVGEKMTVLASVSIAAALLVCGFGNVVLSVAAFALAGFSNAALYPVQSESLNELIPSEQRATLISVDSMFFSVFMIFLFPAAGVLADRWGLRTVLAGIGALLLAFIGRWTQKRSVK